jgi:hypothetical protein
MKKYTKVIIGVILITVFSFVIGILSGKSVLASVCNHEVWENIEPIKEENLYPLFLEKIPDSTD